MIIYDYLIIKKKKKEMELKGKGIKSEKKILHNLVTILYISYEIVYDHTYDTSGLPWYVENSMTW